MPHINRIRVNNVKYNFGTQFYDDFVMRFSCKNTIYDLANGGGKSVLMLLLLQNLIPNCTLDDKQPIEKLFRNNVGSSVIHSMIEWRLSEPHIKNGFKYMTTGFCARKAKDATLELDLGNEGEEENAGPIKENASIEYFNYCIFYREFNDHDIKNFPLSNGKERITYNGLKTYLRELEKKDFNLEIKIFERKNEYQKFITSYGLYESEWEIIRGINKTEGHVRTYFESNYKTARKVVEDLLIEEIIQKSFNNTVAEGSGDIMANTLMDIKDQLLELSKRKDDINNFDFQTEALENFIGRVDNLKQMYTGREDLNEQILRSLATIKSLTDSYDKEIETAETEVESLVAQKEKAAKKVAVGEVRQKEMSLAGLKERCEELSESIAKIDARVDEDERDLIFKESCNDYLDYVYYRGERNKIKEYIENSGRNGGEAEEELKGLVAEKKKRNDKKVSMYNVTLSEERTGLEGEEQFARELSESIKKDEEKVAVTDYIISDLTRKLDELANKLTAMKSESGLLITSVPAQEIAELEKKIASLKEEEKNAADKINGCRLSTERASMQLREYSDKLERINEELRANIDRREKIAGERNHVAKMMTIYGSRNEENLYDDIMNRMVENTLIIREDREAVKKLRERIENIRNGIFAEKSAEYRMVFDYICKYHGNCAIEGSAYLENKSKDEKEMLLEKAPFLPYAIVITGRFEDVFGDVRLREMKLNGHFVPVIKEEALNGNVVTDDAVFVMASNKLYFDNNAVEKELQLLEGTLKDREGSGRNHENAMEVYEEDIKYVRYYFANVKKFADTAEEEYEILRKQLKDVESIIEEKEKEISRLSAEEANLSTEYDRFTEEIKEAEDRLEVLNTIRVMAAEGNKLSDDLDEAKASNAKSRKELSDNRAKFEAVTSKIDNRKKKCRDIETKIEKINEDWKKIFSKYYDPDNRKTSLLSDDELDAKLLGLIEVVEAGNADLADKQKLLENYDVAMEKSLQAIDYKGTDLEKIVEMYEKTGLTATENAELLAIKNKIQADKDNLKIHKKNYEGLRSECDRVEGAIAEAKAKIFEKYQKASEENVEGNLAEENFSEEYELLVKEIGELSVSYDEFIADTKKYLKQCDEKIGEVLKKVKSVQDKKQRQILMERDLDRIVNNGNINTEISVKPFDLTENIEERISMITEKYDEYVRETYDRKAEFDKDKLKLVELLVKTGAAPLAEEMKHNVEMPKDMQAADELMDSIKEVIRCIELEKGRVIKSMEEMAKIKESFENQCIQSCLSIKTQIDRLPKLSKITMEDEVISIISLTIPYVKEELYKERMSGYIDDIVKTADGMASRNDRLKYIRNQLAWKKLFSVIVTDMNGIRLNLYKRERIREQSRYLPYEEAVGSTGQSQGIYIQFLIAIINYITNINSKDADNTGLRKVIFIDNPFGAAKDVYIWEPIFKLLKVNNVQLVVPARGATPAITGRFDVNYILGQKLIDGKQQTVVVDYSSNVEGDKLDYTKVDFTQVQLF